MRNRTRARFASAAVLVLLALCPAMALNQVEYDEAVRIVKCDCGCHPQSVHDCACGRAAEMREEIADEMEANGWDADQLVAAYIERFGEQIRLAPTASGFNLVAWLGPGFGLIAAGGLLWLLIRRWHSGTAAASAAGEAAEHPERKGDAKYLDRLAADLKEYSE